MNEIERNGRLYRYDLESDSFYAVPVELNTFDKYAWIVTIILLSVLCIYLEYFK
jgi:hypothetical protein